MFYYAQLDKNNICIAVSQLSGEVNLPSMILLDEFNASLMGKGYHNGIWRDMEGQGIQPTDTQQIMQSMTDAELRDLETQEKRELMARQMAEIELMLLGGNA